MRIVFVALIASMLVLAGCDFLFAESGISPEDPYDENCNLKESYHKEWRKYSDFDYRIEPQSRSWEAQQYYTAVDRIAEVSAEIYELQRDTEVENLMREELLTYRQALITGHKQNLIKSFLRLSLYTADITWQNALGGKGYGDLLTDTTKTGIQLVGEGMKLINSYAPSDSIIAIDTSTVQGKVNDVARTGWMETVANIGTTDAYKVPLEMTQKATRYVMQVPDVTLSKEDIDILRKEHLELHRIDGLLQDADKRNFDRMWNIRELEAEKSRLEGSLFDLEYDEKERVDAMLIGECKRKLGEDEDSGSGGIFSFLFGGDS